MQSVDGDEDEQPSSTSFLNGTSSSRPGARSSAPRPNQDTQPLPYDLPPLVAADEESSELKHFREQWRSELKRARDEPGSSSSAAAQAALSREKQQKFTKLNQDAPGSSNATNEWKRQRELERREALLISREEAEPLPFAAPTDEPLVITPFKEVETLHIGVVPDEVLIYLFCFLDEVSLVRLALACKKSYSLSREPVLWRLICKRIWAHNCTREVYHKFGTWQRMFMMRPKVRFDGIFVSKNTYLRPGSTEWSYNQPVHQVTYYRYLRLLPEGRVMYAMALDVPRKALKWFNLRNLEQQSEREKVRTIASAQSHSSCYPSPGTYTLDDVTGNFEMWVQGKAMTQNFICSLRRKQAGRYINIAVNKYFSTSKSGITTDYDSVTIAPFHFFKLPAHILDPAEEIQQPQQH